MDIVPIWKDYYVTLTDNSGDYPDGIQFRIKMSGSVIYQGLAFAAPGDDEISVRINDICADQFYHAQRTSVLYRSFTIEVVDYDTEAWTQVESVIFLPDWSWDEKYDPEVDGCNFPINGVVHPLQMIPVAFYGDGSETGTMVIHTETNTGDFNLDFRPWESVGRGDFRVFTNGTTNVNYSGSQYGHEHWLNLRSYSTAEYVICSESGVRWDVKDLCGGVVLYYVNAYGYFDSFVPEGRTKVSDALTHHNCKGAYTNGANVSARGTRTYVNELARKFTFRTGPLTTEQSKRMHHLLNSPFVIMHDMDRNEMWPITLTGNNTEHKTNAGKLHYYEFEAQLAQDMVRR